MSSLERIFNDNFRQARTEHLSEAINTDVKVMSILKELYSQMQR